MAATPSPTNPSSTAVRNKRKCAALLMPSSRRLSRRPQRCIISSCSLYVTPGTACAYVEISRRIAHPVKAKDGMDSVPEIVMTVQDTNKTFPRRRISSQLRLEPEEL